MTNPFDRARAFLHPPAQHFELPLFPLHAVLFPGGLLRLKVFEARYLDLVADCLQHERTFGICLIKEGGEVGPAAVPETVGCQARILSADMERAGVMLIALRGEQRFIVDSTRLEANQLLVARVHEKADTAALAVPAHCAGARDFLATLATRLPEAGLGTIEDDAGWVGFRLAEILPLKLSARQALLEMNDAVKRLEILLAFMRRHDLL